MNKLRRNAFILFTVFPGLLVTGLFLIYPAFNMLKMSMFEVSAFMRDPHFVGAKNFIELAGDLNFHIAFKNTMIMLAIVPAVTLLVAIILAILVTQSSIKGKAFFRVIFFFPSIMSVILIGIIWSFIYHPNIGVINSFLNFIGLESLAQPWLGSTKYALKAIMVTLVWQGAGYYMVMYVAGIDRIPKVLYEAASIDGASKLTQFFVITAPFLWDVIRMTIIFALSSAINIGFILTTIMTSGGPGYSTTVILRYMYTQAFANSNFGYAMAIATVMLFISLALSFISNILTKKESIEA